MTPRGNQSRRKSAPFSVTHVPGRGYAVANGAGGLVTAFGKDKQYVEALCEAKTAAALRAAMVITRPCLCCSRPFASAGIHNRMCGSCRHQSPGEPSQTPQIQGRRFK